MNKVEIVKEAFSYETLTELQREYYSDDYQFVTSVGDPPMDLVASFGIGALMQVSIPDIDFIIDEIHQEGEDVMVTGHYTGIFKNDLDLSAMNLGVIPATGKALNIPRDTSRISYTGDKISKNQNLDTGPDAGMAAFLAAFGAG